MFQHRFVTVKAVLQFLCVSILHTISHSAALLKMLSPVFFWRILRSAFAVHVTMEVILFGSEMQTLFKS
jgi:hypothetical protein